MNQLDLTRTGNAFLDHLPEDIQREIQHAAVRLTLRARDTVYLKGGPAEHAYFPLDGFISNVTTMRDGDSVEAGIVGREGMTGFPLLLTQATSANNLYSQIGGDALQVSREAMVAIIGDRMSARVPFLSYAESVVDAVSQYAACNRLHNINERFARWLVMAHDRVVTDEVPLTHEFLSLMLGVRRAGVSLAASTFQNAGVIKYTRGNIVVVDRPGLQALSCECYDTVEDRNLELMGFSIRKYRLPAN